MQFLWRHCGFCPSRKIFKPARANLSLLVCTTGEKSRCNELRNASILFPKSNLQFDLSYDISRAHAIFLKKRGSPKGGRLLLKQSSAINSRILLAINERFFVRVAQTQDEFWNGHCWFIIACSKNINTLEKFYDKTWNRLQSACCDKDFR